MGWRVAFVVLSAIMLGGCVEGAEEDADGGRELDPAPSAPILFEGAEADSDWYARTFLWLGVDNRPGAGEWHPTSKQTRSGNHSWTFQDESTGRYHDAATFDLHGPAVDLGNATKPMLRFYYRGESELESGDEFSWGRLVRGVIDPFGSTDRPANEWTEILVDLTGMGPTVELMFRFHADECGGDTPAGQLCGEGTFEGYFVDDIEVFDAALIAPSP